MGSLWNNALGLQAAASLAFKEQVPHATLQDKTLILKVGKLRSREDITFPEFHGELKPEQRLASGHQGQCAMGKEAPNLT